MDSNNTNPLYTDSQVQVANNLQFSQPVMQISDPLALNIPDEELEKIVDKRIEDSKRFFEEKYNLKDRRSKNEKYLFGRQIQDLEKQGKLKDYETRSNDNVLYEIEATLKPLAMSKLPDILVTPGADDPDRQLSAENLTKVIDDQIKERKMRQVLGLGFKHLPTYFTAILKARWDPELGDSGDYTIDNIHPDYVVVDHTATSKDQKEMSFIAQCVPMSVQEGIMKWPGKKDKFFQALQRNGIMVGQEPTWKDLASEIKVWEVWFDWYKRKDKNELLNQTDMISLYEPGVKWQKVCGVLWKYEHLILDKMLDPNYDHEGEQKLFTYQVPGDESTKQEVKPQDVLMSQMMGQPLDVSQEQVFHNYFKAPQKPFYFFGYDQWGKIAYDETSRIEQNIRNQENLDDQNKTMLDQLKTRVKHIWSKDSGLKKGDVQRLDMDDPKLDALVEGNPNEVHGAIVPERPDQAQFAALHDRRDRMYGLSGSQAVRGDVQTPVATTNQIAREGNFTRSDDLVEDTINEAAEWIARWNMQFIKLRYTDEHMKELLGPQGHTTYVRLRRDTIADGMEVMIKASSTDKLKAQRNALQLAGLGAPFTNPIDLFKDMDMDDPEGRAERGIVFATDPQGYFSKYILGLKNTQQMAQAIEPQMTPMTPPAQQQQMGPTQQMPSPLDTANIAAEPPQNVQGSVQGL